MSYTKRLNKPPFPMHNPATPRGSTSTAFAEKESPSPTYMRKKKLRMRWGILCTSTIQISIPPPQKKKHLCTFVHYFNLLPTYSQWACNPVYRNPTIVRNTPSSSSPSSCSTK